MDEIDISDTSSAASPRPSEGRALYGRLAFWAAFGSAAKIAITYLFFQWNPKLGTAVTNGVEIAIFYAVLITVLCDGQSRLRLHWPRPALWAFAYSAFAGISVVWSQTASSFAAIGYWVGFAVEVGAVILLMQREDGDEHILVQYFSGYVWANVVVACIAWTTPGTYDLRLGHQEFLHPNGIGVQFGFAALLSIYLALRNPRRARLQHAITLFIVLTLLRCISKGSIISFFCASGYYLLFRASVPAKTKLKFATVAVLLAIGSWAFVSPYMERYTEGSDLETVTGRTAIWDTTFEIAMERPWMGHGLYSYRYVVPAFDEFESWHAHNEWLQQLFSYGIVGLCLAIAVYWSFYRCVRNSQNPELRDMGMLLLIYCVVHGLTDTSHIELTLPIRFVVLLAAAMSSQHAHVRKCFSLGHAH